MFAPVSPTVSQKRTKLEKRNFQFQKAKIKSYPWREKKITDFDNTFPDILGLFSGYLNLDFVSAKEF